MNTSMPSLRAGLVALCLTWTAVAVAGAATDAAECAGAYPDASQAAAEQTIARLCHRVLHMLSHRRQAAYGSGRTAVPPHKECS